MSDREAGAGVPDDGAVAIPAARARTDDEGAVAIPAERARTDDEGVTLHDRDAMFRQLTEKAVVGIYVIQDGRLAYVNETFARTFGYEPDEISGRLSPGDLIHPDDRGFVAQQLRLRLEGVVPPEPAVIRGIRKDGTVVEIEVVGQLMDFRGRPAVQGTLTDVTERRRVEAALQHSEERFRSTLDQMFEGAMLIGFDWEYLYVNDAAAAHGHARREDLVGHRMTEMYPGVEQSEIFGHYRRVMEERVPERFDASFTFADGTSGDYSFSVEPVAEGIFVMSIDITERKRAELALRQSEERFRTIFEEAPLGVALVDAASGRIVDINARGAEIAGRTHDALIELDWMALASPEEQGTQADLAARLAAGDLPLGSAERRVRRPDGSTAWVNVVSTMLRSSDPARPLRITMFEDITERREAEAERADLQAQLAQAERLQSIGRLAGGVAHDFNNMLGVILGNAEFALGQVDPGQPLHADLIEIQKAARRSAELTRSLLAFARIQPVAPRVLDVNEAVSGTLAMLRRLIGEDIRLEFLAGTGLWPVRMDPSQLDQVLANLCVNARDAIGGVGAITITTSTCAVDAALATAHPGAIQGDYVRLAIRDTGVGMAPEVVAHIFEPFYTTKPVGAGTGLGLATVYGMVRTANGFVTVASAPGAGTTFEVYLPRHVSNGDQADVPAVTAAAPGGRETILLVEDEPALLGMTVRLLEGQGYHVLAANGPAEALRLAADSAGRFDLLVTDVVMPGLSGTELARRLQAWQPHLRRLFISGYPDRSLAADEANFVSKPFTAAELAAAVRSALDEAREAGSDR